MRAGAQVGELALLVERDGLSLRQVVDQLNLVRLVLHQLECLVARQLKALNLELLLADLAHLRLDLLHDLRRECERAVQIVVKAVVDGRTDCQLDLRIQTLDRLRQNVRAAVPIRLAILFVFERVLIVCHDSIPPVSFEGEKKLPPRNMTSGVRAVQRPTVPPCLPSQSKRSEQTPVFLLLLFFFRKKKRRPLGIRNVNDPSRNTQTVSIPPRSSGIGVPVRCPAADDFSRVIRSLAQSAADGFFPSTLFSILN